MTRAVWITNPYASRAHATSVSQGRSDKELSEQESVAYSTFTPTQ